MFLSDGEPPIHDEQEVILRAVNSIKPKCRQEQVSFPEVKVDGQDPSDSTCCELKDRNVSRERKRSH